MTSGARAAKRQQPERGAQAAIVKLLRSLGAAVYVVGTTRRKGDYQGTMMSKGIPDVYAFLPHPGIFPRTSKLTVWFEVKARGGRQSLEQRAFQIHCEACGQAYVLGGIDVAIAFLREGGWLKC